jgi:hypothetical protein
VFCGSALTVVGSVACGQKGPPLPPIVRTPVAPVISADRRGSEIQIALTAPAANVDGSRPANVTRVDIYAINGATTRMTDLEIMKRGTRVASISVKSPRDPNDTAEKDESVEDTAAPVGDGLEQGAASAIAETISAAVLAGDADAAAPLLGPPATSQLRTYVGVGIDRGGHPGQFSARVSVPLQLPPLPPPPIAINYEEKKIVVTWKPASAADGDVLPSHTFGPLQPDVSYNLYDGKTGRKLNDKPVREFGYEDTRMDFGTERCYTVRAVVVVARLAVESEASGPACRMLVDTYPPAAPRGLNAVASAGSINLIWDANAEADLAGYYVWRAIGAQPLQQITPDLVTDAAFFDGVQPGLRFTYAVQAVDKAGNKSPLSERVEETAR